MGFYQSKIKAIGGSDYGEVYPQARFSFNLIKKKSKRKPYIKSRYFKQSKVFIDYFWQHLIQKTSKDRIRRLKFLPCAFDLIKNNPMPPITKENPNNSKILLHRFFGKDRENKLFCVQILENKKTDQKHFMSVFPYQ